MIAPPLWLVPRIARWYNVGKIKLELIALEAEDILSLCVSGAALLVSILAFCHPLFRHRKKLTFCDGRITWRRKQVALDCIIVNRSSDPIAITAVDIHTATADVPADRVPVKISQMVYRTGSEITDCVQLRSTELPLLLGPFESKRSVLLFPIHKEQAAPESLLQDRPGRKRSGDASARVRLMVHTSKGTSAMFCPVVLLDAFDWDKKALHFDM